MESRLDVLIDLLHRCDDAALATHSLAMPGFPFATALPFVTDDCHRPVFLISALAEHTQNLAADPRASLLVRRPLADGEVARATLVGRVGQIKADSLLVERYLRYQSEAERFLQLGDFRFFRLDPERVRIIGGFAQAGWLTGDRLGESPRLTLREERELMNRLAVPAAVSVLGVDRFGADLRVAGNRRRIALGASPEVPEGIYVALQGVLDRLQD